MNNNQSYGPSSAWSLILGAVAGLGTIVAAVAPLTVASSVISQLFVAPQFAGFLSIVSLITITLLGSFYASKLGFNFVPFDKVPKMTRNFFLGALFSILAFFITRLSFDSHLIDTGWGTLLQAILYVLSFGFLGSGLGLFLRDMYQRQQYDQSEKAKLSLLRNLLIEGGHLKVDFKIYKMEQNWGDTAAPGSYLVIFGGANNKKCGARVDRDFRQILDFQEIDELPNPANTVG